MTVCRRGDVVLIPFPFTDLSTFKQRPALVLSSDEFNAGSQDVITAAITSHLSHHALAGDFTLREQDLRAGGLPRASTVRLGKIVTLDKRLIRKKLGCLPEHTVREIGVKLHSLV